MKYRFSSSVLRGGVGGTLWLLAILLTIQQAQAVTVSPLTFEINANAGDTLANFVLVENNEERALQIEMLVQDFVAAGERGEVLIKEEEKTGYGLVQWITTEPRSFVVEPRSTQMVKFTIRVPANAEPGGHYASILATISGALEQGTGVAISQKVGSLLLVNVAGEVRENMNVLEFSVPEFSEYGPESITARFSNEGTVHLKPRGFVIVKNMLGSEITKVDLPQLNVLPNSVRKMEIPLEQGGQFGRYEATLAAIYGATNEPVSAITVYWVIPWKVLTVVGAIILVLLVLIIKTRKRLGTAFRIIFKGNSQN